jgi:hypothetical protein
VADARAEILGMIAQLTSSRRVPLASRKAIATRLPLRRATVTANANGEPALREDESNGSLGGVMHALRSLESRLTRIEDGLKGGAKATPSSPREGAPDDATFSGAIQGQMLSDMLQLVSSNAMSGIFVIENDNARCTLYFEEGRMCHAQNGDVTGEEAFFAAFASEGGRYHFKETSNLPPERTVSAGTQFLVLEALRRMDEGRAK